MTIDKAIFITNVFAEHNPESHVLLWRRFENEVPVNKRSGVYGSDNLAYINWLKKEKDPVFLSFIDENISIITV